RPEAAAVLAHPLGFLLETAFARRRFQGPLGIAALAVLRGVELREMPADDFGRLIALDAPGAGIPTGDDAFRAQHVDRIVGDALDQQAELLLAAPQRLLSSAALGEVAGDLGEADQPAVGGDD